MLFLSIHHLLIWVYFKLLLPWQQLYGLWLLVCNLPCFWLCFHFLYVFFFRDSACFVAFSFYPHWNSLHLRYPSFHVSFFLRCTPTYDCSNLFKRCFFEVQHTSLIMFRLVSLKIKSSRTTWSPPAIISATSMMSIKSSLLINIRSGIVDLFCLIYPLMEEIPTKTNQEFLRRTMLGRVYLPTDVGDN